MIIDLVKVFSAATVAFFVGMALTPILTHYLYEYKLWKKKIGKLGLVDGKDTVIFNELHKDKEIGTPRMGGIVIWASVAITTIGIWLLAEFFPGLATSKLDFLSRNQTWIPLFTLLAGAFVGLIDDYFEIRGVSSYFAGGLSLKKRLLIVGAIAFLVAFWFYFKLDVVSLLTPWGAIYLGWLIIPFFIGLSWLIYSGGVIDGIDGLAGGVFAIVFSAYGVIAFYQDQINLSAFCFALVGGILAFLWFNIPPARFYMSETGSMALTITLAVVAFMTDSLGSGYGVLVLPIIALPLIATSGSNIIQVFSKKFRNGKKVFLVAPLHHHFEALGWPSYKVTMRYWVITIIFAIIGIILAVAGKQL